MNEYNNKINVLWLVDHLGYKGLIHGASKYYLDTIPVMDKNKFNIILCVLRAKDDLSALFENKGITVHHLGRSKLDPFTLIDVIKLVKKEKINIIHCHGYGSANFGRLAGIFTKVTVIVHSHDNDLNYPLHQKVSDFLLSRYTDKSFAVSEAVKQSTIQKRKIPADRVSVIYNGIPMEEFKIPELFETEAEKKRLGINPGTNVIGTVAQLRVEKGIEYLLKAVPKVLSSFPNSVFIIVGDGSLREELEALTKKLNIEHNVIFTGFSKKITCLLSIFDIKVLPSLNEGFGLVIVEAMVAGKPVIATNVGGIKEILRDGETGLFVPPADPDSLAEKIVYLLKNKDLAKCMGKKAKEESKKYDIKSHVKKIEEQYLELVAIK